MIETHKKRGGWSWWYLLFVIQFAVALWPPFYNKLEPTLMGIPFFYWFQLAVGHRQRGVSRRSCISPPATSRLLEQ